MDGELYEYLERGYEGDRYYRDQEYLEENEGYPDGADDNPDDDSNHWGDFIEAIRFPSVEDFVRWYYGVLDG